MGENRLRRAVAGAGLALTMAVVLGGIGSGCSGCRKTPVPVAVETVPRESLFVTDRGDTITADSARRYRAMMALLAAQQQRRNDSIQTAYDAAQAAKDRAANRQPRRRTSSGGDDDAPATTHSDRSTAGLRDNRTEGEIEAVANRHDRDVRLCLETYKRDFPTASGEISLTINVTPEGNVSAVNIVNRGNLDAKTVRCVTTRVRGWTFERVKPSAGTYTTGRYSYHY